ncbi:unnamed protein product [Nesidiocoris tenuis]|uniref:THAP-type domain-containing protein n=1 Tax=Nesidiocoris tenuis TaxID=355587 RepID=A0A6H5HEU8_9HEMI|nr:unnamed protein product [Nesidiocoris tenuis]
MSQCFAYGCNHREMHETCQFFRFPKDPKTFKRWRDMSSFYSNPFLWLGWPSAHRIHRQRRRKLLGVRGSPRNSVHLSEKHLSHFRKPRLNQKS